MTTQTSGPTTIGARLVHMTSHGLLHVILVALGSGWLVPSLGLFVTSWRSRADIAASGWWTALVTWRYTAVNYVEVLTKQDLPPPGFTDNLMNSLIITVPSTVLPILIAAWAAYAFAWLKFRGRDTLYLLVIALLVVPLQTTWMPVLRIFNRLGLTGTWVGIWLAHTAYGMPFAVFLLRNFFAGLPGEIWTRPGLMAPQK